MDGVGYSLQLQGREGRREGSCGLRDQQQMRCRRNQMPYVRRDGVKISYSILHVSLVLLICCTGKLEYSTAVYTANDCSRVRICPLYLGVFGTWRCARAFRVEVDGLLSFATAYTLG